MFARDLVERIESAKCEPASEVAAAPALEEQIAKLHNLHQAGALSDTEFAAAKARLLG